MENKMKAMFEELAEAKALSKVRSEVQSTTTQGSVNRKGVELKEERRGKTGFA